MRFKNLKKFEENIKSASMEIYGNSRVIVVDCKSVIDYSADCIALDLGNYRVKIKGNDLICDSFVFGQTDITGEIKGIEYI